MPFRVTPILLALTLTGYLGNVAVASVNLADTSQIITINATPNILLIPDTSESMQEGLDGRVALDWSKCIPGPSMQSRAETECIAGARSPLSKANAVKRVSKRIVNDYGLTGKVNIGLLSYQQYPASTDRESVFPAARTRGTALWRLYHRPLDVKLDRVATPSYYKNHDGAWNATDKRYRDTHPTISSQYFFYNSAIPGYERTDFTEYCQITGNSSDGGASFPSNCYESMSLNASNQIVFGRRSFNGNIFLVDSMRQRGITGFGQYLNYLPLYQDEWRSTMSPGLGFLHNPIKGIIKDSAGKITGIDTTHFNNVLKKLEPQQVSWNRNGNPMTDPNWPLISAGLNPIEGTIYTARDYFLRNTTYFKAAQGNTGNLTIPESCGINAAVWVTNGLPSVAPDGSPYGTNPVQAMQNARTAIQNFYNATAASAALGGPVKTYIVGFAMPPGIANLFTGEAGFNTTNPLDFLAAAGGTERAYSANNEGELLTALDTIFQNIVRDSVSSSGLASTSTELSTDTKVFQSELNTVNWSGDLLALNIVGGNRDRNNPAWRASAKLTALGHANRNIVGSLGAERFNFTTAGVPAAVRNLLKATGENDSRANSRINYIRGDRSNEGTGSGKFRERAGILGHIVNSTPLYVPGSSNRPAMLYIMANDGMLHGFNANTGEEIFAYIPGAVLPKFIRYSSANYAGEFMLDGQLAYYEAAGKVYLTGTGGTGVKLAFALDISNPNNFKAGDVLWEASGDAVFGGRLGFTGSQPVITEYAGKPAVVIGNGYNSQNNRSSLLVIDLKEGNLLKNFDQDGLGFGSPGSLDLTRNNKADFIYVGDFNGKLWRFTLNSNAVTGQAESRHLFTTENARPLVVAPVSASHPDGGVMVVFGTGELMTVGSRTSTAAEYVYALHDRFEPNNTQTYNDNQLVKHQLTGSSSRSLTTGTLDANKVGWRVQLPGGERLLANAAIRRQKVIFGSYKPDNTACNGGGQGYMTELNLLRGSRTSTTNPPSKTVTGIPRTPIFIEIQPGGIPVIPGCTENCVFLPDDKELLLIGEQDELHAVIKGRQLWREVDR